jgi:hypothetical protein
VSRKLPYISEQFQRKIEKNMKINVLALVGPSSRRFFKIRKSFEVISSAISLAARPGQAEPEKKQKSKKRVFRVRARALPLREPLRACA